MNDAADRRRIFVDSNIPMYLVGGEHPHRTVAQRLVSGSAIAGHAMVTDAEVLQEILHRYVAIDRRDAIGPAFAVTLGIVAEILPIERFDVERARRLVQTTPRLSARDVVHVAVMQRYQIDQVMTFDAGFDGIPGLTRLT